MQTWYSLAEEAIQRERTVGFLEIINYSNREEFQHEVLLRLAQQHKIEEMRSLEAES